MKFLLRISLLPLMLLIMMGPAEAQIIKKPRINLKKEGQKVFKKVFGEEEEENTSSDRDNSGNNSRQKGKMLEPPKVADNLDEASYSLDEGNYGESRYYVQQAMMGIELEIGKKILEDLPEEIMGIPYDPDQDELYSNGAFFTGLAIGRVYYSKAKEVKVSIVNNSALINTYSMALASSQGYNGEEGTYKTVRVQGNKAYLQYNPDSGDYGLGIPIGQSTVIVLDFEGFADEGEVMTATDAIPVEQIKNDLGEQ
ncbi:MAG: hypothetical protein AAGC85_24565 [Bacteroidota bacterium]